MSKLKQIDEIVLSYSSRLRIRNLYYRFFHKFIVDELVRKGIVNSQQVAILDSPQFENITDDEKNAIISLADKTLNNTFNYLGSGDCKLDPINWSQDFKSGYVWPVGRYYKKYRQVDLSNNADVKVPRELSRSHFLLHLALAYQFTNDDKYARKAFELIEDWIDNNPLMYSINWGCAMDVAIRAVNWIWALPLLESYKVPKETSDKINGSLYQHGWFIYHNFEGNYFNYNHNHYFSDLVGLIHISLLFKGGKQADKWFKYSLHAFYREVRLQVLPSGMSFEGSTNYNRLLVELIIPTLVILKRNGVDVPPDIWGRLESMFDSIMNIAMPNGEVPIIGDQDNGRCLPWGAEPLNDERYLMSVGAVLFERSDFKAAGNGYNVYCAMFGDEDSKNTFDSIVAEPATLKSRFYRDAGFAITRSGNDYLLFNADNQGMYRDTGTTVSHTHCDWFSFVLAVNGIPFIVDPGSYVYSSDASERNRFRSTAMHNTLVVNGENQEKVNHKTLWDYRRKSHPVIEFWRSDSDKDTIACCHESYNWLGGETRHKRKVEFEKKTSRWIIEDVLESTSVREMTLYYHLDVDVDVKVDDNIVTLSRGGQVLALEIKCNSTFRISVSDSHISKCYGELTDNKVVCVTIDKTYESKVYTTIWKK